MKMLALRVCLLLSMIGLASSAALAGPLHDAVRKGDLDAVRQLIGEGADVNARDELGLTSLHAAVLVDHVAIAELMIAKGANINARASNGQTPWDLAVALRRTAMAELLEPEAIPLKTDIDKGAWISDLETLIPQLMERAHVPGLSIAVIRDAEIIWTGSFGVKSNQTKEAVNDTTAFQAASLSKTTFAYAVMKLVEQGKLDLDTPLSDYLPGRYIENDDRVKLITARMVLSHTTGFPNWRPKGGALRLYFTPGEKFSYSGEGYVYLQKVVEHITGQPLDRFMQEQVFEPLGMRHSSYEWRDEYESNYAVGHNKFGIATDRGRMRHANAASSLYTTAGDYARFLVAIMRGSGLQEKSIGEMLTPQVQLESCLNCTRSKFPPSKLSKVNAWGLGWGLQTTDEGTSFWHWGDQGIFMCYTVAFKDQKLGLVYYTNSKNGLAIRNELVYRTIGGRHPAFSWSHYDSYQLLDFSKVDTTVNPGVYDDYVGQYAYNILTVTREGERVFAQMKGQPKFEIFPKSETEFFWKVVDAQVEFVKDDEGKVTHALHDQGGIELTAPKIKDTDVESDIVGQYAYAVLTVTREGDRLFAQLTRQRKFEIFPKSETEFFWKVVNAQVTFVKNEAGVVTHAHHRQLAEFDAPKIKPGLIPISARASLPGELAYHDGTSTGRISPWSWHSLKKAEAAVKFTPSQYPATINKVKFYTVNYSGSTKLFNVHGYEDCGDLCSKKIFSSVNDQIADVGRGWVTVDVPDTTIEAGSFWISMEWQTIPLGSERGSNSHFLGYDANADHTDRNYQVRNGNWSNLKDCSKCVAVGVGDLMITAVMGVTEVSN